MKRKPVRAREPSTTPARRVIAKRKGGERSADLSAPTKDEMRTSLERISALYVVYDADGTHIGELMYMIRKALGIAHCSACDITHGPREEKPEFTRLKLSGWNVPMLNIHRDEMDDQLRQSVGSILPVVAARTESGRDVLLLGPDQLDECYGSVASLEAGINAALAGYSLTTPPFPATALGRQPPSSPDISCAPAPLSLPAQNAPRDAYSADNPTARDADGGLPQPAQTHLPVDGADPKSPSSVWSTPEDRGPSARHGLYAAAAAAASSASQMVPSVKMGGFLLTASAEERSRGSDRTQPSTHPSLWERRKSGSGAGKRHSGRSEDFDAVVPDGTRRI